MYNRQFSRRIFLRNTVIGSAALAGSATLPACSSPEIKQQAKFPVFNLKGFDPKSGVAGVLYSQLSYEPGFPVRIIVRVPEEEQFYQDAECILLQEGEGKKYQTGFSYWGEIWKSHWWVAEFTEIDQEEEYSIEIHENGEAVFSGNGLVIKKNGLWDSTIEWSSVDMLERRRHFTKVGAGWQDAGTLWVESPAQSAMIITLGELLENSKNRFDDVFINRINTQITVGCDYLVMTQEKANELGFIAGAFTHDLHGHETDVLATDGWKAVVALAKAARVLPDSYGEKKKKYEESAGLGYKWLLQSAKPAGDYGYMRIQRGLSQDTAIPEDEWLTRDLTGFCTASLEMYKNGMKNARTYAIDFARQIMKRQIPKEEAKNGYYGNFYEFSSLKHAETSWIHGIAPGKNGVEFGADIGGIYPNYLIPFIEMLKMFPEHQEATKWRQSLHDFTYGYLIPACEANPFYIVPQGIFDNEGPLWFCGTFHGTNAIYGYTAALAFELAKLFDEPKLKNIAYGNLQWIAGLNAGITRKNIKLGCVVYSTDIPEGMALPASMICHIGKRWAGTWFQTRGSVCNGFSTGAQFVFDSEPKKENDGPLSFTDEDWIPHSAGWLSGLMRMRT